MKTEGWHAKTTYPIALVGRLRTTCTARLLPLLLLTVPAVGQAQFNYTTNDSTITITKYTGSGGAVTIPDTINGLPVTSIGDYAFEDCYGLTSVMIGTNVTNIGAGAFYWCNRLTSITIPNSVTSIGYDTFFWCKSLTSVTIPNSVTSIGDDVFDFCISLTAITVDMLNSVYCSVDGVLFDKDQTTLIQCPGGITGSFTVPASVTSIEDYAFVYCTSLTSVTVDVLNPVYSSVDGVLFNKSTNTLIQCPAGRAGSYTIPNSVTSIGSNAFTGCGLTNVMIGNSVTSIGYEAFAMCVRLTRVIIGNGVTSIGDAAFGNCTELRGVYFKGNAPSIGSYVFYPESTHGYWTVVYYLPGTTGWGNSFGDLSTAPWYLPNPLVLSGPSVGVQTNGFGFIISWATNISVVVEVCTNFVNPAWQPVQTNTLTDGWCYFSDPDWTNYPVRFYRLRSP